MKREKRDKKAALLKVSNSFLHIYYIFKDH